MKNRISKNILMFLVLGTSSIVAQETIEEFLKNQPIIDVHIHITKGYTDNKDYNKINSDIDIAKIEWMRERFDKNNIVFALGGPTAFAGSIIFPIFLYETLRKIGFSEGIAGAVLGLGFLVFYATVMDF